MKGFLGLLIEMGTQDDPTAITNEDLLKLNTPEADIKQAA